MPNHIILRKRCFQNSITNLQIPISSQWKAKNRSSGLKNARRKHNFRTIRRGKSFSIFRCRAWFRHGRSNDKVGRTSLISVVYETLLTHSVFYTFIVESAFFFRWWKVVNFGYRSETLFLCFSGFERGRRDWAEFEKRRKFDGRKRTIAISEIIRSVPVSQPRVKKTICLCAFSEILTPHFLIRTKNNLLSPVFCTRHFVF